MGDRYTYCMHYKQWTALMVLALLFLLVLACMCPSFSYGSTYKEAMTQPSVTFFAGNQDIPVMPGLVELEARSFSYDKPEGEITEIVARIEGVNDQQVLYYYEVTLPQFGWNKVVEAKGGHFFRKSEYLDFSFDTEGAQRFVKIMIRPSR